MKLPIIFPDAPSLGWAILTLSFPGPDCLTRHIIIIRNEGKGTRVYIYIKKEMLMYNACRYVRKCEEWKHRVLMWLCSSEKHHSRLQISWRLSFSKGKTGLYAVCIWPGVMIGRSWQLECSCGIGHATFECNVMHPDCLCCKQTVCFCLKPVVKKIKNWKFN